MNQKTNQTPRNERQFARLGHPVAVSFILFLAVGMTGCSLLRFGNSSPTARVKSEQLVSKPASGPVALSVLQQQVMRFADTYAATVAQACDDVSAGATNTDLRLNLLRWKLGQATSAYTDATGQNPAVNALDMLVLVTMARMVVQGYGVETYGDAIQPLLAAQRNLEASAWTLAVGVLKPSQVKELKDLIQEWHKSHPDQRYVGPIRFREFVTALGKAPSPTTSSSTSLFSLLYLDPLAGLDPAAAAIQETRELGERAMYYSQRMPMLLSWQVEVLAFQLADQPESKQVLSDANRLAASADVFAKTAQQLPQVINDQRQAAIQQIFDNLASQGDRSRGLLSDTRTAIDSANMAATNINAAVQSLLEFVQYVSPTNTTAITIPNGRPFNVLDYGTAAAQVGAAANDLNRLLNDMSQSAPQIEKLGRQSKANADAFLLRAFVYCVLLILLLLAGAVLAGLTYRRLSSSPAADRNKSSHP